MSTTTTPTTAALPAGPILLEVEPGTFVDLTKVIEFRDIDGVYYLVCGAPDIDDRGPHLVYCEGEARRLALGYARAQAAAARAALEALADTHAADIPATGTMLIRIRTRTRRTNRAA